MFRDERNDRKYDYNSRDVVIAYENGENVTWSEKKMWAPPHYAEQRGAHALHCFHYYYYYFFIFLHFMRH